MFSLEFETYLKDRGHHESAEFVHLVWCWHAACDQCGTCADYRVASLYEMYSFLTKDCDSNHFPSQFCHRHYKDMPIQTFEALLQNITTCIQLYSFATGYTCTTQDLFWLLTNKSFFSDLTWMDKESTYYPKACNIPKLMGKVVTLNYLKHKPDKSYALNPTSKGTYPVHILQHEDTDTDLGSDGNDSIYKDHFFDKTDVHTSHRICRSDLSTGLNPLRCVGGVCRHCRSDKLHLGKELECHLHLN